MARPQSTDYDAKRQLICQHAAACFAQLGYPSASMVHVASACGMSKAGLYHYYTSKEAVLFDVLDGYVRELLNLSKAALKPHTDPQQAFNQLIIALLDTYASAHHQHRVLVTDTQHLSPALREQVLSHQRQLVHIMAAALQAAFPQRLNADNASAHAMMVFGMLNWTFTWLKTDGALSYQDYANQVVATVSQGLASLA